MILLDTCSLIWLVGDQESLSEKAKTVIGNNAGNIFVSSISAFEISLKVNKGHIKLPLSMEEWFFEVLMLHGLIELSVDSDIAIASTQLEKIHNDPADRIIIATAKLNHLSIVTPDKLIAEYENCKVLW